MNYQRRIYTQATAPLKLSLSLCDYKDGFHRNDLRYLNQITELINLLHRTVWVMKLLYSL